MNLAELADSAAKLELSAFLRAHPEPALVFPAYLSGALDGSERARPADETGEFKTTTHLPLRAFEGGDPAWSGALVVFLKKRSSWTPFNDVLTVGRATIQDVCIALASVSKFHACIAIGPEGGKVTDQRAANGTFVNGQKLPAGGSHRLEDGAKIGFGPEAQATFFTPQGLHALLKTVARA